MFLNFLKVILLILSILSGQTRLPNYSCKVLPKAELLNSIKSKIEKLNTIYIRDDYIGFIVYMDDNHSIDGISMQNDIIPIEKRITNFINSNSDWFGIKLKNQLNIKLEKIKSNNLTNENKQFRNQVFYEYHFLYNNIKLEPGHINFGVNSDNSIEYLDVIIPPNLPIVSTEPSISLNDAVNKIKEIIKKHFLELNLNFEFSDEEWSYEITQPKNGKNKFSLFDELKYYYKNGILPINDFHIAFYAKKNSDRYRLIYNINSNVSWKVDAHTGDLLTNPLLFQNK